MTEPESRLIGDQLTYLVTNTRGDLVLVTSSYQLALYYQREFATSPGTTEIRVKNPAGKFGKTA